MFRLLNIMRGDRLIQAMLVAYTEVFADPSTFPKAVLISPLQLYNFCTFQTFLKTEVTAYLLDPAKGRSLAMQLKAVQVPSETHKSKISQNNKKERKQNSSTQRKNKTTSFFVFTPRAVCLA